MIAEVALERRGAMRLRRLTLESSDAKPSALNQISERKPSQTSLLQYSVQHLAVSFAQAVCSKLVIPAKAGIAVVER